MRLPVPLCKLPLRFDVGQLTRELQSFKPSDSLDHPAGLAVSKNIILVSVNGQPNDDFASAGAMRPTALLRRCPYLVQVMAAFRTPVLRCRLTRLDAHAVLGAHEDANFHWFRRVRIHVPIVTNPAVTFRCEDRTEHMAPGEAWVFDNFREHEVRNLSNESRVHLIFDARGSRYVWSLVEAAIGKAENATPRFVAFNPRRRQELKVEQYRFDVPTATEVDALVRDVIRETIAVVGDDLSVRMHIVGRLEEFRRSWRRTFGRFGPSRRGLQEYAILIGSVVSLAQSAGLYKRLPRYSVGYGSLAVLASVFQTTNRVSTQANS